MGFRFDVKSGSYSRNRIGNPVNPNVIELGANAFVSEEELANTIAHELNHVRSFLKGGDTPAWGKGGTYPAGGQYISRIYKR